MKPLTSHSLAHPSRVVFSLSALALLVTGALLYAGPLDPPAGPITSTYKTLTEVEPRIAINATNTPGDADSLFKITQPGSYYLTGNITGVVGKHGVEIDSSGVTLDLNGFDLVGVPGMGIFDGVSANGNQISVLNGSVRNWGGDGVNLGTDSLLKDLRSSGNAGNGLAAGSRSVISHCTSRQNTVYGIRAGSNSIITSCTSSQNTNNGFDVSTGSTVTNCTSSGNTGQGFKIVLGTISGCSASANSGNGIECVTQCLITGNNCSNNGSGAGNGAGIFALSDQNRIEGNACSENDRGIEVSSGGNIIIRNTCSMNTTNWVISTDNRYGPIISITATGTAAVNGNSAASTLATTDPNANFSY